MKMRNVEPNCIRLGSDLPESEGPGRVCEAMEANTKVEVKVAGVVVGRKLVG